MSDNVSVVDHGAGDGNGNHGLRIDAAHVRIARMRNDMLLSGQLPRGWLDHKHLEEACSRKDGQGKVQGFVDNVVSGDRLFRWIRECMYKEVTPAQYRAAVKRLVISQGLGYSKSKVDGQLRKLLEEQIKKFGKKQWPATASCYAGKQRKRKRPAEPVKQQQEQAEETSPSRSGKRRQQQAPIQTQEKDQEKVGGMVNVDSLLIHTDMDFSGSSRELGGHRGQNSFWPGNFFGSAVVGSSLPRFVLEDSSTLGRANHGLLATWTDTFMKNWLAYFKVPNDPAQLDPELLRKIRAYENEKRRECDQPDDMVFAAFRGRRDFIYCNETFIRLLGADRSKIFWPFVSKRDLVESLRALMCRYFGDTKYKDFVFFHGATDGNSIMEVRNARLVPYDVNLPCLFVNAFLQFRSDLQCFVVICHPIKKS